MNKRIEVGYKRSISDPIAAKLVKEIKEFLDITVDHVVTREEYIFESHHSISQLDKIAQELFCDPVIQEYSIDSSLPYTEDGISVTVFFKPGVTDNIAKTVRRT